MKSVLTAHEMVAIKLELHDQSDLHTDYTIPAMLRRAAEIGYRRAMTEAANACEEAVRANQPAEAVVEALKKLAA